jgi:D-glycero-D-manno-heptose 1,7-bisphosphate phosphatase
LAKRFVLIDRDGTLIVEKHYLSDPHALELIPDAAPALRRLLDAGWGVCVITNQAGVGRGFFDMQQLDKVHRRLEEMLAQYGVKLDGLYLCPHDPKDNCYCRKPSPGLVHKAIAAHGFDPKEAWVIGDKDSDIELGNSVGAKSILVRTGYGKNYERASSADFVVDDLVAAVELILRVTERDRWTPVTTG